MTACVADDVGAVHVGVDDVGPDVGEVGRQRADRDRVVGLVDDERPRSRPAGACGRRCPADSDDDATRRSARGSIRVTSAKRCSWAPPFVPVARTSTTRIRRRAGRALGGRAASGTGPSGTGALISRHPSRRAGRGGAGSARRPRPTRTCTARRRAGSRAAGTPVGERPLDVRGDHQDARRQVARVGVDAGVVVEVAVGGLEVDAGRDPPAADRQEREAERPVRPEQLEQPPERRRGSASPPGVSAGRARRRPSASGGGR